MKHCIAPARAEKKESQVVEKQSKKTANWCNDAQLMWRLQLCALSQRQFHLSQSTFAILTAIWWLNFNCVIYNQRHISFIERILNVTRRWLWQAMKLELINSIVDELFGQDNWPEQMIRLDAFPSFRWEESLAPGWLKRNQFYTNFWPIFIFFLLHARIDRDFMCFSTAAFIRYFSSTTL